MLPSGRLELNIEFESDVNLIWQAAVNCRVVMRRLQLIVPRVTFNSEGQSLHSVYALTLYEQEAELVQQNGKLLFR